MDVGKRNLKLVNDARSLVSQIAVARKNSMSSGLKETQLMYKMEEIKRSWAMTTIKWR